MNQVQRLKGEAANKHRGNPTVSAPISGLMNYPAAAIKHTQRNKLRILQFDLAVYWNEHWPAD